MNLLRLKKRKWCRRKINAEGERGMGELKKVRKKINGEEFRTAEKDA